MRKSLLVADRSTGQTRFSMLETIRQFAEEQLAISGGAEGARTAHARYFAEQRSSRRSRCGTARDSARRVHLVHHGIRQPARRVPVVCRQRRLGQRGHTGHARQRSLGVWLEQYEPVGWAEELLEPARAVNHRRLLQLYVVAAQCYAAGRTDDAFGLSGSQPKTLTGSADFDRGSCYESQTSSGIAYMAAGRPGTVGRGVPRGDRTRAGAAHDHPRVPGDGAQFPGRRRRREVGFGRTARSGRGHQQSHDGLLRSSSRTELPTSNRSSRLHDSLRRALAIAQDCGNRQLEAATAVMLSLTASNRKDPSDSLDYLAR